MEPDELARQAAALLEEHGGGGGGAASSSGGGASGAGAGPTVPVMPSLLRHTVRVCEELRQAREDARLKPSVARQLNERIRALEAERDALRSDRKVAELERKVHVS